MSIFTRHRTPQLKATLAIGIALSLFGLGACFTPDSTSIGDGDLGITTGQTEALAEAPEREPVEMEPGHTGKR